MALDARVLRVFDDRVDRKETERVGLMNIENSRLVYKSGKVIVLFGLLYFCVYLLARNNGEIVHVENRGSLDGRSIKARSPEWIEIQEDLAEDSDSAMLAFSVRSERAKPLILNTLF